MLKVFLQKNRHISMFFVIFGLIMANFFHAFLMNFDPMLLADNGYGACHTLEAKSDSSVPSQQNNLLPCCADKKSSEATTFVALIDFNKIIHPLLTYSNQTTKINTNRPASAFFLNPPNQVALNKIILRI